MADCNLSLGIQLIDQQNLEKRMEFRPCTGKCTDEGTSCEGCGRSHEEIAEMKPLISNLVAFAEKMGYDNVEEYANSVAGSIKYKMSEGH